MIRELHRQGVLICGIVPLTGHDHKTVCLAVTKALVRPPGRGKRRAIRPGLFVAYLEQRITQTERAVKHFTTTCAAPIAY